MSSRFAESVDCDVLVVGGGGAGLRAALAASGITDSVVLATRGKLGCSGVTAVACSDRMAFHVTLPETPPGGPWNWAHHAEDIYRIGGEVSDPALAEILAKRSERAFSYLSRIGVPWVRDEQGDPKQFLTDGSRYPRACYTGPYTANDIHSALQSRLQDSPVRTLENCMVVDLLRDEAHRRVVGAVAIDECTSELITISALSVVLATGGAGSAFARSVFPTGMTGDGYAMALRAGAELVNMEFIQMGICSVATSLACSGSLMRALPRVVDDRDCELLSELAHEGYSGSSILDLLFDKGASWPVSFEHPSHKIDVLVARAAARGGRIYLDYGSNPSWLQSGDVSNRVRDWYRDVASVSEVPSLSPVERLQAINPESVRWLADHGIDLRRGERIDVAPFIQHFQGGIRIGADAATAVGGLYACGECAGAQHGANRPGGSALLDGQVFGEIAGNEAAYHARQVRRMPAKPDAMNDASKQLGFPGWRSGSCQGGAPIAKAREALQLGAGVVRTESGLRASLDVLEGMDEEMLLRESEDAVAFVEARNACLVGQCILRAALMREESRGPHLRFASEDSATPSGADGQLTRKMTTIREEEESGSLVGGWMSIQWPRVGSVGVTVGTEENHCNSPGGVG